MSDFRVTLEAAWIVRDVASAADAVGIAVSECGRRLQPSAKFVDVDVLNSPCPHCGREITTATVAARTALVGLLLSMRVFDANSPGHAEKISLRVIGTALRDVPLSLFEIEEIPSERHETERADTKRHDRESNEDESSEGRSHDGEARGGRRSGESA